MQIYGIDFTSRPSKQKPITCAEVSLSEGRLGLETMHRWSSFTDLENFLDSPGPWIAGFDFPFSQAQRFIQNIGWPKQWHLYVKHVSQLSRQEFRDELDSYRALRKAGDKEHRRAVDILAGAISPQKLFGVPVALMFYEGWICDPQLVHRTS